MTNTRSEHMIAPDNPTVQLSAKTWPLVAAGRVVLPDTGYVKLPVKVLQFGTGVLLRGLCDELIDKANRQGIFNGRIAVIKSTSKGNLDAFAEQDNLYTVLVKGIENNQPVAQSFINSSISQVFSATDQWDLILKQAENPCLQIIISNTTEAGIELVKEDIRQRPPMSFPAKLLAVLYHRYQAFSGSSQSGLVILPTELLADNATRLQSILAELIAFNNLEKEFSDWLCKSNHFCNSLVDRIVPGKPSAAEQKTFENTFGYRDELLIVAEPYLLWAIQGNEQVKSILSFEQADAGVIVVPDITVYRELKLRLLNGTHTLSCALAIFAGFNFVNQATSDKDFAGYLEALMSEIRSAMADKADEKQMQQFSSRVLDRFKNPYIGHLWINIAQQYTLKIVTRVLPVLKAYYRLNNRVPENISRGFAAYLLMLSLAREQNGAYTVTYQNTAYRLQDDKAGLLVQKWAMLPKSGIVKQLLNTPQVWNEDLNLLPGFADALQHHFDQAGNGIIN